jgi:hypothetical protein
MQAQQAPMIFTEAERQVGDRLLKLALETDRVEGYTEPHAVMIARLSETIGQKMGLHGTDLSALKFAALAHDIGERGMKRNYLLGPNTLTWEERLDSWRHPILGEQAAAEMKLSRQAQLLVRWHHEWWNGQGYPDGLSGEAIPLGARILRAVDSYCSLISARPFRQAYDLIEAEGVIADMAGIEFDPLVARLLLMLVGEERVQREAEIELQQQEAAIWNIPPQFEQQQFTSSEIEIPNNDEIEEELQPDSALTTELPSETQSPEEFAVSVEVNHVAAAYEPFLSFAEAESDEADLQVVSETVGQEQANEIPVVETTPPDQIPTAELAPSETLSETKLQPEQIQNSEAEPEKESGETKPAPQIQN